jgi:hypothetical protein
MFDIDQPVAGIELDSLSPLFRGTGNEILNPFPVSA